LHKKRERIKKENNLSIADWFTYGFISPGLDDWRTAIEFGKNSFSQLFGHFYSTGSDKRADEGVFPKARIAKQAEVYKRFGLTNIAAVKEIRPEDLYFIEQVFGDSINNYVNGDITRFRKLHEVASKMHWQDVPRVDAKELERRYGL
jgi:hypothetical protein